MMEWVIAGLAVPAVGWALSVEQRLTGKRELKEAISEVKLTVEKVEKRQEDLIDFLLRNASERADKR